MTQRTACISIIYMTDLSSDNNHESANNRVDNIDT